MLISIISSKCNTTAYSEIVNLLCMLASQVVVVLNKLIVSGLGLDMSQSNARDMDISPTV